MPVRTGRTSVNKSEENQILKTLKDVHFTGSIPQNEHETENITGLGYNKVSILGINIQTTQNLHFAVWFWGKDTFDNIDLDTDSFLDFAEIDIPTSGKRVWDGAAFYQYYLNVSGLKIVYEDEDETQELHISLQNLSPTAKAVGSNIQIDILYSPRL